MINFFKSFILTLLSILVIFYFKFKKHRRAQFSSVKPEYKDYFDPRTKVYLNKKKSIFFIRSQNFYKSLNSFLKTKNTVFFNHMFNLNYIFGKLFFLNENQVNKLNYNLLLNIFKYLRLKEFYMIDDYRHLQLFSKICSENNVRLFLYQHGRFSISQTIQKNIRNISFEKYYVWSNFFKRKLLEIDNKFNKKKIFIKRRFKNYNFSKKNFSGKILIIQENKISKHDYDLIIKKILSSKIKYDIFFKFRPFEKKDLNFEKFLIKKKINIVKQINFLDLMKKNFDFLISFNSTMLLESSFYGIAPIMVYKNKPNLIDYVDDGVFFISKIKDLEKNLNHFRKKKYSKVKIFKKKIWDKC